MEVTGLLSSNNQESSHLAVVMGLILVNSPMLEEYCVIMDDWMSTEAPSKLYSVLILSIEPAVSKVDAQL
jgi:hypothetical protein